MVERRLTEREVAEIRVSHESNRKLARHYKVGQTTIARVKRKETYRIENKIAKRKRAIAKNSKEKIKQRLPDATEGS